VDNRAAVTAQPPVPQPSGDKAPAPPQPAPSDKVRTGKLRGRPLYNVLKENSIREPALTRITAAIASLTDIREFSPDDTFELVWERSGRVRYVLVNKGEKCFAAIGLPDGQFRAKSFERKAQLVQRSASGTIRDSLWVSLEAAGVPAPLILDYADIFSGEIDFMTELQNGDAYVLDWQRQELPGQQQGPSRVLYASYSGKTIGLKKAYYYSGHYFDENGQSLAKEFLRAPLNYRRISSHFTKKRLHPVLKVYRQHNGVDYSAPAGTPVSAVSDGVVTLAGRNGGLGNCVEIRHADGYETSYGHLQKFASGVKRGKRVSQGDVIGYVGSTGLSTGPHLDFRIQRSGQYFDYLAFKPRAANVRLDGRELEKFREYAMSLDQRYGVRMPASAR